MNDSAAATFSFEERPGDSQLVALIWRTQSEVQRRFTSVAVANTEIVVTKIDGVTHMSLHGPETRASRAYAPAGAEMFGIQLNLGAYVSGFSGKALVDAPLVLQGARRGAVWLNGSAVEVPDFEDIDAFVTRLAKGGLLACDPVVQAVLQGDAPPLSPRAVQRRFVSATGLTQSSVAKIRRAEKAKLRLEQGVAIADVVYQGGYSDQPHLTRALKTLMGHTPGMLLEPQRAAGEGGDGA